MTYFLAVGLNCRDDPFFFDVSARLSGGWVRQDNKTGRGMVFLMNMSRREKTYLFVCLANMNRSPTAATVFKGLAKAGGLPVKTYSAGVSPLARKPVTKDLAKRSDLIFVMEDYMKKEILSAFDIEPGKIVVLDIPDIYDRDDPLLVRHLRDALLPYTGQNV